MCRCLRCPFINKYKAGSAESVASFPPTKAVHAPGERSLRRHHPAAKPLILDASTRQPAVGSVQTRLAQKAQIAPTSKSMLKGNITRRVQPPPFREYNRRVHPRPSGIQHGGYGLRLSRNITRRIQPPPVREYNTAGTTSASPGI